MGIGRREFLKFAVAALGGLMVDPIKTIAVNGDYYVNAKLGLGFMKPSDWTFDVFKDFATLLDGQIIEGIEPDDEEEFRRDQTSTLVAAIAKYNHSIPKFSPSITVFKNQDDRKVLDSLVLDQFVLDAQDGCTTLLKDYEVIEQQTRCEFSKCDARRFKARWLFQHKSIQPTLIDDETLVIDQGTYLYSIHLYDSPYTGDIASKKFRQFVESLHIA
jgi:hypothetical protein